VTVEREAAASGWLFFAAEQAANRFDHFIDGVTHRRFGTGNAFDGFFGDFGDAGAADHAAGGFIDAGDGFVDGTGDRPGSRLAAAA
jgi:hypothetical protein